MPQKGSILMISLWIVAILAVFAIGLGHRALINLKVARYQRDRLKATCLAKAGINKAVAELKKDSNEYDSLSETWSTGLDPLTNQPIFENVEINPRSGETFSVRYLYEQDRKIYYCMQDEERRININTARKELLVGLLEEAKFAAAQAGQLADYILVWRGDNNTLLPEAANFKKSAFSVPEELLIVLQYYYQKENSADYQAQAESAYANIKDLITVSAIEKININTAPEVVLGVLAKAVIAAGQQDAIAPLVTKIIAFRQGQSGPFNEDRLTNFSDSQLSSDQERNIWNNGLRPLLGCHSRYFRVEAIASLGKVSKSITAVVNRGNPTEPAKIVYWHEN